MNGEVNGTMEEPMESSLPSSPVNIQNCNKVTSEDCETTDTDNKLGNIDSTGTNNHLDNDLNKDAPEEMDVDSSCHEDNGDGKNQPQSITESSEMVPTQENSNNITDNPLELNSSNSNESYPESLNSSRPKTEIMEKQEVNSEEEQSKDGDAENNCSRTVNMNDEDSEDEVDSEEDSSDECSEVSAGPRAEDTVSINSDSEADGADDTSQESESKNKNIDIIILENDNGPDDHNGNSHDSSPEVHEIISDNDNDDCVVTNDEKSSSSICDSSVELRRSSRAVKRKIYIDEEMENGGDGSDIEEVEMEDPLNRKTKPIIISDTKALVAMAVKQAKLGMGNNNQKKEPTVVIIDTNSIISGKSLTPTPPKTPVSAMSAENLYQSIVARGTTVTPVSSKTTTVAAQNSTPTAQTSILPSLTDDMFVVEAPSFIVPYVYEKPSVKPFREFVDILGKELEEQRAKEEQERLEKEKLEKEKREKERKERKERGEEVEESELDEEKDKQSQPDSKPVEETEEQEKKKKKAEKERRRRKNEEDDVSWDGESSVDSEDGINSDEDDKTVVIKDKADSIEEIKDVSEIITDKVTTGKSDNYFDCSLGKFFINIGLNFVQEYVQNDLLKQQNRKLYREKKSGHSTKATESSISSLMKNLEFSKENNAPYRYPQIKCEFCSFKTESMLVMSHHLETPHMKNNVYKCNFCPFEIRSPHDILYHMEAEHNTRGKLERAPAYHQCANCPFEDNGKGKLARHLIPCAKKFKPEVNLAPPIEWEPPAKIPKITRSRNNMLGSYQSGFGRAQIGNNLCRAPMNMASLMSGAGAGPGAAFRARGRAPAAAPPRATMHGATMIRGVMVRHTAPSQNNNKNPALPKSMHQPSISITPLPRQPQPAPAPAHTKSTFVICEICDGYIKDLEQLRNHMQWIHKVKIHPKMIYNRPPLNCQKCQFRFFTDQGLERHLLGSHGLVTSSMQEAANKGKDAGRCPVCGRVYQWKLLNHVARDHNLTLKPAHLSYKCTVCTATFGMYKQFENHVYSAHSVVAKRVMDKSKAPAAPPKPDSLLKPLKINDEITIIPQPISSTATTTSK